MPRRTLLRCLTIGLLGLGVVGGVNRATAHSDLVSTDPSYGAALASAPGVVLLRFNYPVDLGTANVRLERAGTPLEVGTPTRASSDGKDVSVPLQGLGEGSYVLTWSLLAQDGHVMAGALAFSVLPQAAPEDTGSLPPPGAVPVRAQTDLDTTSPPGEGGDPSSMGQRPFSRLASEQAAVRFVGFLALVVLVGGAAFVAVLWPAGAVLRRTRLLLWIALVGALLSTTAALGLQGAAVQDRSALTAFSPSALTALAGSHVADMLMARAGFLLLAIPVVAYLTTAPHRAIHSYRWMAGAATAGLGSVATHGLLGHSFSRGPLASATDIVHLAAVSVWLGGLIVLTVVVLPRRRGEELSVLVPRFSRIAFAAVSTAVVAGTTLLVLISPQWRALPSSGYGRLLLVKLGLVALLLAVASRSRDFVQRRLSNFTSSVTIDLTEVEAPAQLPVLVGGTATLTATTRPGAPAVVRTESLPMSSVALRPFVVSVTAELCMAAGILATTAVLVGRSPPA